MKTKAISTVLAVVLVCALWATSALALSYTISGYTNTAWVIDPTGALVNGPGAGTPADTGTGQSGQYSIYLFGGSGDASNASGFQGILSIFADDGSANYNSGIMQDTFYFTNTNGVFTLGSSAGALLELGMGALAADPNFPGVVAAPALVNATNTYAYVNQVYGGFGDPVFSYGPDGNLTNPTTAYGSILSDGFVSMDASGNVIDMVIADANVPVPEPSTFALLAIGLAGFGFLRKRRA